MTTATLGFEIDSSQAAKAVVDLDALVPAAGRAEAAAVKMGASTSAAFANVGTGANEFSRRIQQAANDASSMAAKINTSLNVQNSFGGASRGQDIAAYGQQLDALRAKYDPLFAAGQQYKATLTDINKAVSVGALTQDQGTQAIMRTKTAFVQQVEAINGTDEKYKMFNNTAKTQNGVVNELAHAHANFSTQAMAAQHAIRSTVEMLAQGVPVTQVMTMHMNELAYAASGPGGLSGAFKEAASMFTAFINPITLAGGVLGGLAYGVYALNKSYMDYAKTLDDVAKSAGAADNYLAKLQDAASVQGVDQSSFFTSMTKFGSNVYSASQGMGSLSQLLAANGQKADNFADAMGKVADLVEHAKNSQQALQILQEAGLPANMAYVRLMQGGADGLKAQAAAAATFGNTFDTNMIEKARAFDQDWNRAWTNFSVYARGSIQEAKGWIEDLNNSAGSFIRNHMPFGLGQVTPSSAKATLALGLSTGAPGFGHQLTVQEAAGFYKATGADIGSASTTFAEVQRQAQVYGQLVSALGPLATVDQIVTAQEKQLRLEQMLHVPITNQQIGAIEALTRAQAEYQKLNEQVSAGVYNAGLAGKAAADQIKAWVAEGILNPNNPKQMANAWDIMTFSLENLKAAAESANPALKALSDLKFQGATQFMSPSQVAAAQTARQLYPAGTDWMQHLNDAAPQMAAFNEQLKQAADLSYNFLDTFNQGMLKGQGFAQSLTSALQGLESQLLQMVEKNLINQLFGSLLSGSSAGTTGGTGGILGGLFHTGGIVGGEGGSRYVSPAYFENAPRFHSGGILPGEVPAILKPGEGVFTPGQMRAMGSPSIQNNIQVVNQGGNSTAQVTSSKRNGTGGVDLVVAVTSVVNDKMVNGGFDQAMRGRYGIAPSARPR